MSVSFVVPTVECIRGYDLDLTILLVILSFPNDVYSLMITSQVRMILEILVIQPQKCFVFSLA